MFVQYIVTNNNTWAEILELGNLSSSQDQTRNKHRWCDSWDPY